MFKFAVIIVMLMGLPSFAVDLAIEDTPVLSNAKVEKCRVDLLKARDEYRSFYDANQQIINDCWKLDGEDDGVKHLLREEWVKGNAVTARMLGQLCEEIANKYMKFHHTHEKVLGQFLHLSQNYDYKCACFAYSVSEHMGVPECDVTAGLQSRLGFDKKASVECYAQEKKQAFRSCLGD